MQSARNLPRPVARAVMSDRVIPYSGTSLIRKSHPPRTLQEAYAWGPMVVLGEAGHLLMSEVLALHEHVHSRNALNSVGALFFITYRPYSRAMPRDLRWSWGVGRFLMSEVPL